MRAYFAELRAAARILCSRAFWLDVERWLIGKLDELREALERWPH